jgi:Dolichyl-phosphate-mannose-protein mannosyltransferase
MRDPRGCADFRRSKPSARRERSLAERFILIMAAVWVLNMVLVAIPGHFSHDELDWMHLFRTHNHGWDFWLADVRNSPFFRPLGAVLISKALRLPLQPFATHALLVFVHGLNCCLLYLLMLRFYPQRALAAALLFAVMPGAAFGTGWIAASFDILSVLFGLAAMNAAIAFWRGHAAAYAGVSTVAFALALLCKETSLVIPAAVLIFFYLDHPRADLSRAGILAAGMGVLVLIYLAARLPALLHLGTTGAGGYGFGGFAAIFTNTYSYFGYPFAIDMAEVSDYANRRPFALFAPSAIHLFLVLMIWIRFGARGAVLYVIGYSLALAPVLIISKYETQYLYAPSLAISVAVALIWRPEIAYAVPAIRIGAALIYHGFVVQKAMYVTGVCQTRMIATAAGALSALDGVGDPILYGPDNTPWWVAARALLGVPIRVGEREINVKFAHEPDGAALKLLPDCTVVKNETQ